MIIKDLILSKQKVQPGKEWVENTLSLIRTLWAGGGSKREQKILSPWGKGTQVPQSLSPGGWHRSREGKMDPLEKQVKEGKSRRNPTSVSCKWELQLSAQTWGCRGRARASSRPQLPTAAVSRRSPRRRMRVGTPRPLEAQGRKQNQSSWQVRLINWKPIYYIIIYTM